METTTLQVTGMTCGHCEKAVKEVSVSLKDGKVEVGHDSSKAPVGKLKEAVEDQGYDVV